MPIDQEVTVNIVCDNPDCPGNELDPADRMGWFFVSSEIYGQPTKQHVFCCGDCAAGAATSTKSDFATEAPSPVEKIRSGPAPA